MSGRRNSAQRGLATFEADAGFRDVRLTLGALVPLTEHWLVGVRVMLMRLVGDAADSPIVDGSGSANQLSGGCLACFQFATSDPAPAVATAEMTRVYPLWEELKTSRRCSFRTPAACA